MSRVRHEHLDHAGRGRRQEELGCARRAGRRRLQVRDVGRDQRGAGVGDRSVAAGIAGGDAADRAGRVAPLLARVLGEVLITPPPHGHGLAAESGKPLGHIRRIARLAGLAVVDDVEARRQLPPDRIPHGRLHRLPVMTVGQARRARQAARVSGQDSIRACSHRYSSGLPPPPIERLLTRPSHSVMSARLNSVMAPAKAPQATGSRCRSTGSLRPADSLSAAIDGDSECFGMRPAIVLGQDLAEVARPVRDGALADLATRDRKVGNGHRKAAGT